MLEFVNRFANSWVATPVICAFARRGMFDVLLQRPQSIDELVLRYQANAGHLQAALRMLFELGWIDSLSPNHYQATVRAKASKYLPDDLDEFISVIMTSDPLQNDPSTLSRWLTRCTTERLSTDPDLAVLLEGALLTPILSELHTFGGGMLEAPPSGDEQCTKAWSELQRLFIQHDWGQHTDTGFHLSPAGRSLLESGGALGMLVSYAAMFRRMDDLLFGEASVVFDANPEGHEGHVDRTLNVTVSGWQHQSHFAELDLLIIDIFDRTPLVEQPRYIADMGCGDGSLLLRIYQVIATQTQRGQVLGDYPLMLIGIDYNVLALEATGRTLVGLPHYLVKGDIADPQQLIQDLMAQGIHDIEYILHIRTFLDHDRPFMPVQEEQKALQRRALTYNGVYVGREGQAIDAAYAVQSLVEHLRRWQVVVSHFGLILLEVHCLCPLAVRRLQDSTESLYFDAYHAFSRQQLVEAPVFLMSAVEAGLFPQHGVSRCIPKTANFTRISLHYLMPKPYSVRHPTLLDLPELETLDQLSQPENLRTPLLELERRLTDFPQGQMVLEIDRQIVAVLYTQRITSVDDLSTCQYRDLGRLHQADGRYLQLLGLYVLPEMYGRGYSDTLLELMLTYCTALNGIDFVVGVTRCANFVQHKASFDIASYIQQRNSLGQYQDSMLYFHGAHGAVIHKPLPGFRPEDTDNGGVGVLIEYFLQEENSSPKKDITPETLVSPVIDVEYIVDVVRRDVLQLLGGRRAEAYGEQTPLMEMGLSSLELLELRRKLGMSLGESLPATFLFSYGTPEAITRYFSQKKATCSSSPSAPYQSRSASALPEANPIRQSASTASKESGCIAIIGMACRFPGNANTPEQFWQNLMAGKDNLGPLPAYRQSLRQDPIRTFPWQAGFLSNVDLFDARFFRISPREAELLDPQQRLLLEVAWETLESAAIAPSTLRGTRTGVFVGMMGSDYQALIAQQKNKADFNAYFATGNACSVAAGRLSYFFDWQGPAICIDTACSSSLVAIHTACRSLLNGECQLALAAGVNLLLDDKLFMAYEHAGMLSPDGYCKTFDTLADGYVRGEGCAAIALKKLNDAQADGDRILGVIRGSAINQDGSSSGLTVPNQRSQQSVITAALSQASVEPHEISYLEAHGTGTKLGDPIEVMAAAEALGIGRARDNPLLIGSVKSAIGHLEAAAGIAGLIKILLSMAHDAIPAQLHFSVLNPLIPWADLPVKVVSQTQKWPVGVKRAALSSFGFSGTNGHMVIEEYTAAQYVQPTESYFVLIVLSARSTSQLHEQAKQLLVYLSENKLVISDLAYTLQVGREAFGVRLAFTADTLESVQHQLMQYLKGDVTPNTLYQGDVKHTGKEPATFLEEDDMQKAVKIWLLRGNIDEVAALWVKGGTVEWQKLYVHVKPQRIYLPTYPFSREHYWVPVMAVPELPEEGNSLSEHGIRHPLLHRNTSDLSQVRYSTTLTGNESFLREHLIRGEPVVPGVAQLEWARAAVALASGEQVGYRISLEQVTWQRPLYVTSEQEVHISLQKQKDGRVYFRIYCDNGEEGLVYSQGYALYVASAAAPQLNIAQFQMQCPHALTGEECYRQFAQQGFNYGASFQVLQKLTWGSGGALGVFLPNVGVSSSYEWPIVLLDGALQATIGLMQQRGLSQLALPFALEQVMQWAPLSAAVQVIVQPDTNDSPIVRKLVLFLVDADGLVVLRLSGFSMRAIPCGIEHQISQQAIMMGAQWKTHALIPIVASTTYQIHGVILCEMSDVDPQRLTTLTMAIPGAQCQYLTEIGTLSQRYIAYAQYILLWLQQAVKDAKSQPLLLQIVLPDSDEGQVLQGLSGMLNSAQQEYPALKTQLIIMATDTAPSVLAQRLQSEAISLAPRVRYSSGIREVWCLNELTSKNACEGALPWRDDGVYLITGGLGGLGQIFTHEIVQRYHPTVILIGRSSLSAEQGRKLVALRLSGANIIYQKVDVCDVNALTLLVEYIIAEYSQLNGIIHSAGTLQDGWLVAKTPQQLHEVLAPKVTGLTELDKATKDIELDWLVLCSSISSVLGNTGQTDYAAANGFMDAYAGYRETLATQGLRHGRTVSIGWPLWTEGGMQMDVDAVELLHRQTGQVPLPTSAGLAVLRQAIEHHTAHIVVCYGEPTRVRQRLADIGEVLAPVRPVLSPEPQTTLPIEEQLRCNLENEIATLISKQLYIRKEDLERDTPFPEFGYDSIMLTLLSNDLNEEYDLQISPTLFFEYSTIANLANYLISEKLVCGEAINKNRDGD
ncbi:type I polyketide synthase [Yersinia wautersii]|uniref:Nonribosomal peptide synthetase n=1 Tax=Yersinia wautersii TaxID=1341643 RepID=A0ABM9TG95_9GAMM|nr:type I polyketide synthase [Yersinia wautersii]CRG50753.1 nonribosomal peptide synthetase [Yersinia wautersii]